MSRSKKNWDHLVDYKGNYDFGATIQKGERGPIGARGPKGNPGPQGRIGEKGEQGAPANLWTWKGNFPYVLDLPVAAPGTNGDTYFVDDTSSFYVSNGDYSYFIIDNFEHVKGNKGEPGIEEPGGEGTWGRELQLIEGELQGQWVRAVDLRGDDMEGRLNVPSFKVGPDIDNENRSQILMEVSNTHILEAVEEENSSTLWESWTVARPPASYMQNPTGVDFGNGFFLAWGGPSYTNPLYGQIAANLGISTDGKEWSQVLVGPEYTDSEGLIKAEIENWTAVAYGGGRFLLTGKNSLNNPVWYYTFNGVDFVELNPANKPDEVYGLHYSQGRWIAMSKLASTPVWISDDNGVSWRLPNDSSLLHGLRYKWPKLASDGNGKWVAISDRSGVYNSGEGPPFATSFDNGENWNLQNFDLERTVRLPRLSGVAYGNGKWVITTSQTPNLPYSADDREVFYSDDAVNWQGVVQPNIGNIRDVEFADGIFMTVQMEGDGVFLVSEDGISWTGHRQPTVNAEYVGNYWTDLAYGNGTWVMVQSNYPRYSIAYLDVETTRDQSGLYYDGSLIATKENLQPVFDQIIENTQAIQGLTFESQGVLMGDILPSSTVTGDPHPNGTLFFYTPTTSLYIRHEGIWLKLTN